MMNSRSQGQNMRFVKNCWVTLVGCVYGMLLAGTVYGFGSFSVSLKSVLKVDEQTKQLIGVCGNLGLWVNVIGGMLSRRFGPAPTILSGTVLTTAGYAGMYAVFHSHQTAAPRQTAKQCNIHKLSRSISAPR